MYLTKRKYVGANYEHRNVTGTIDIKIDKKPLPIKLSEVSEIIMTAGYWRKSNQIHNWFVQNVQDGKDECQESYVSHEKLQELLNECKEVRNFLKSKKVIMKKITPSYGEPYDHKVFDVSDEEMQEYLPTTSGFFFGGTTYDEYHLQDIEDTIKILSNIDEDCEYYYQASW